MIPLHIVILGVLAALSDHGVYSEQRFDLWLSQIYFSIVKTTDIFFGIKFRKTCYGWQMVYIALPQFFILHCPGHNPDESPVGVLKLITVGATVTSEQAEVHILRRYFSIFSLRLSFFRHLKNWASLMLRCACVCRVLELKVRFSKLLRRRIVSCWVSPISFSKCSTCLYFPKFGTTFLVSLSQFSFYIYR